MQDKRVDDALSMKVGMSRNRDQNPFVAANFSMVLGLSGLGQTWRASVVLWGLPKAIGEGILLFAGVIWAWLLITYLIRAMRMPHLVRREFEHPVHGATPALLGIATLLLVPALRPYSPIGAYGLLAAGLSWHLLFALWHTGAAWQTGRRDLDIAPTIYLPTVAGNFTSGAALGAVGQTDLGWLFVGAGFFSWLALESLVMQRLWHLNEIPVERRATLGIQFAPPAVAGAAWLTLTPHADHWVLMLWGYGMFQLLLGLRLVAWLRAQPFSQSYWSYTFGISTTALIAVKLAAAGNSAAGGLAPVLFVLVNAFEGVLLVRMAFQFGRDALSTSGSAIAPRMYALPKPRAGSEGASTFPT